MTRVVWDAPGERLYRTGIDRGMLYIDDVVPVAVPWSGLASVTESPAGGASQPYYIDGQKVLDTTTGEDFGVSIEAFSAPLEFAPCAGRLRLSAALFAADQPKKTFGFAYRTLTGNDVSGSSFGYRIHIIYNALASISDFVHTADDGKAGAKTYSWAVTTVPVFVDGYKPTAHFVFDTRLDGGHIIDTLESVLYGDDSNAPRMPTVSELAGFLASVGVEWWDLTSLSDFPGGALKGDLGVDFTSSNMYADTTVVPTAYWWNLTDLDDFPDDAPIGDWGVDMNTGDVFKKTG